MKSFVQLATHFVRIPVAQTLKTWIKSDLTSRLDQITRKKAPDYFQLLQKHDIEKLAVLFDPRERILCHIGCQLPGIHGLRRHELVPQAFSPKKTSRRERYFLMCWTYLCIPHWLWKRETICSVSKGHQISPKIGGVQTVVEPPCKSSHLRGDLADPPHPRRLPSQHRLGPTPCSGVRGRCWFIALAAGTSLLKFTPFNFD